MRSYETHALRVAWGLTVGPLLLAATAAYAAPLRQDSLTLVEDGRARAAIVADVREGDGGLSPSERWAVKELQRFVKEMSGAELPVSDKADVLVVIGKKTAEKRRPELRLDGLGTDGYVIKTIGNELIIAGGEKRGTMYGVYTLLERLGCRWWTPTESTIPRKRTIRVPPMDLREVPKLEYRDMIYLDLFAGGLRGTIWSVRNKVNGHSYKKAIDKWIKAGGRNMPQARHKSKAKSTNHVLKKRSGEKGKAKSR